MNPNKEREIMKLRMIIDNEDAFVFTLYALWFITNVITLLLCNPVMLFYVNTCWILVSVLTMIFKNYHKPFENWLNKKIFQ